MFIQIPCYNEAGTLAVTLADLPREIPGCRRVSWLIVDDGSTDETVAVARAHGVDHVVQLGANRGLARAWSAGIEACLSLGADIIVNQDGDNQYKAAAVPDLVAAVRGGADIAVGARPIAEIPHFSPVKKALQRLGSGAMRLVSRTPVADAPSGFRALSREAAIRMVVLSDYTYTLETLIHAGHDRLKVVNVPVGVNADLRPSRLVKSIGSYVRRSLFTMVRIWLLYRGAQVLGAGAAVAGLGAAVAAGASAFGMLDAAWFRWAAVIATVLGVGAMISDSAAFTRRAVLETRRHVRGTALDQRGAGDA